MPLLTAVARRAMASIAGSTLLLAACAPTPALYPSSSATPGRTAVDSRLPIAPVHEEVLLLPGSQADGIHLQATFFKPSGPGPFPLAVMNHGATHASDSNRGERYRFTTSAYYFLSRGYAVLLPMARGFAGSGGHMFRDGCQLAKIAQANGSDIVAAIAAVARRPDVDASRIVVAGQSFGGWNTLGVGTEAPAGVRALVAFNPAIRGSDCHDQDQAMAEGAATLGAATRLPSVWFFGENDSIMPTPVWRTMYDRYKAAGAKAELVDIGSFGNDSHQMLSSSRSMPLWAPKVDALLAQVGLPSTVRYPGYLPHPAPPPTQFAALTDVAALPGVNDAARAAYRKFLSEPTPRAFALAPGKGISQFSGGYDPVGQALRSCRRVAPDCQLYAVDDQVVWPGR